MCSSTTCNAYPMQHLLSCAKCSCQNRACVRTNLTQPAVIKRHCCSRWHKAIYIAITGPTFIHMLKFLCQCRAFVRLTPRTVHGSRQQRFQQPMASIRPCLIHPLSMQSSSMSRQEYQQIIISSVMTRTLPLDQTRSMPLLRQESSTSHSGVAMAKSAIRQQHLSLQSNQCSSQN